MNDDFSFLAAAAAEPLGSSSTYSFYQAHNSGSGPTFSSSNNSLGGRSSESTLIIDSELSGHNLFSHSRSGCSLYAGRTPSPTLTELRPNNCSGEDTGKGASPTTTHHHDRHLSTLPTWDDGDHQELNRGDGKATAHSATSFLLGGENPSLSSSAASSPPLSSSQQQGVGSSLTGGVGRDSSAERRVAASFGSGGGGGGCVSPTSGAMGSVSLASLAAAPLPLPSPSPPPRPPPRPPPHSPQWTAGGGGATPVRPTATPSPKAAMNEGDGHSRKDSGGGSGGGWREDSFDWTGAQGITQGRTQGGHQEQQTHEPYFTASSSSSSSSSSSYYGGEDAFWRHHKQKQLLLETRKSGSTGCNGEIGSSGGDLARKETMQQQQQHQQSHDQQQQQQQQQQWPLHDMPVRETDHVSRQSGGPHRFYEHSSSSSSSSSGGGGGGGSSGIVGGEEHPGTGGQSGQEVGGGEEAEAPVAKDFAGKSSDGDGGCGRGQDRLSKQSAPASTSHRSPPLHLNRPDGHRERGEDGGNTKGGKEEEGGEQRRKRKEGRRAEEGSVCESVLTVQVVARASARGGVAAGVQAAAASVATKCARASRLLRKATRALNLSTASCATATHSSSSASNLKLSSTPLFAMCGGADGDDDDGGDDDAGLGEDLWEKYANDNSNSSGAQSACVLLRELGRGLTAVHHKNSAAPYQTPTSTVLKHGGQPHEAHAWLETLAEEVAAQAVASSSSLYSKRNSYDDDRKENSSSADAHGEAAAAAAFSVSQVSASTSASEGSLVMLLAHVGTFSTACGLLVNKLVEMDSLRRSALKQGVGQAAASANKAARELLRSEKEAGKAVRQELEAECQVTVRAVREECAVACLEAEGEVSELKKECGKLGSALAQQQRAHVFGEEQRKKDAAARVAAVEKECDRKVKEAIAKAEATEAALRKTHDKDAKALEERLRADGEVQISELTRQTELWRGKCVASNQRAQAAEQRQVKAEVNAREALDREVLRLRQAHQDSIETFSTRVASLQQKHDDEVGSQRSEYRQKEAALQDAVDREIAVGQAQRAAAKRQAAVGFEEKEASVERRVRKEVGDTLRALKATHEGEMRRIGREVMRLKRDLQRQRGGGAPARGEDKDRETTEQAKDSSGGGGGGVNDVYDDDDLDSVDRTPPSSVSSDTSDGGALLGVERSGVNLLGVSQSSLPSPPPPLPTPSSTTTRSAREGGGHRKKMMMTMAKKERKEEEGRGGGGGGGGAASWGAMALSLQEQRRQQRLQEDQAAATTASLVAAAATAKAGAEADAASLNAHEKAHLPSRHSLVPPPPPSPDSEPRSGLPPRPLSTSPPRANTHSHLKAAAATRAVKTNKASLAAPPEAKGEDWKQNPAAYSGSEQIRRSGGSATKQLDEYLSRG